MVYSLTPVMYSEAESYPIRFRVRILPLSDSQNDMNLRNLDLLALPVLLILLSPAVAKTQSICPDPEKPCGSFKPYELSFRIPPGKLARPEDRSAAFYAIILKSAAPCSIADDQRKAAQADFPRNKVFISRFECKPEDIISYTTIDDRKYSILAVYAGSTRRQAEAFLSRVRTRGSYPDAYLRRMTVVRVHP